MSSTKKDKLIEKYDEEEGLKKYNDFRKKCSIFVMSDDAKEKYKNRKNVLSFEYFLEKTNGNYQKVVLLYKDRQNTSSLDKFIKKYGEEIGTQRYKETNIKKLKNFEGKSEFEIKFIEELINKLDKKYECYYGNNKFMFFTDKIFKKQSGKKVIIADLYIKDLNLCIEIYGDFWHLNPIKFEYDFYSNFHKKLANEVWKEDSDRINFLKKKYNIDTIVVWENEIRTNRQKVIKLLLEKINGIYKTSEKISNNKN